MSEREPEFQKRLLETFRVEAEEHVRAISTGLTELEGIPETEERAPIVEKIFREAHSLKGAARAVNMKDVETICQSLEGVLARAKRTEIVLAANELDVLHSATDEIERLLLATRGGSVEQGRVQTEELLGRLDAISLGSGGQFPQPSLEVILPRPESEKASDEATVRVPTDQLDQLLLQVEELVPARWGAAHRSGGMEELTREVIRWKREWSKVEPIAWSLRQSIAREGESPVSRNVDARRLLEFLEWNEEFSRHFGERLAVLSQGAERDQRALGTMVDSLLRETKLLLLRPFSSLTETLPRIVRDLCRQQGKEATVDVRGADVEIDRRILQEIKDPLIHLMRNAIDHGIEKPEQRALVKKAPQGVITIAIEQRSANKVEIAISDDGAGIDPRTVREAVVRSGLISVETAEGMNEQEILALIFQSGVSTSPIVTDISGRGLGMAIVREKVEKLGGDVTIETRLGAGTTFRLLLPLTLSTMRGVLVRVGEQRYIIPVTFIDRVASIRTEEITTVENRATVVLGNEAVSFVRLKEVLVLPGDDPGKEGVNSLQIVVLSAAERRIAFQVDEVIGEQEVLVKSLGPQLARVRNVGGAAVLATGKLVLILNAADLMKSAVKTASPPAPAREIEETSASRRRSILVVDDSITARTLLKSILEAAGYMVRTAVDGAEAFASLREGEFGLVVSDVDMPRMNGFDLTARIRADKKLADLPLILVTALESRQDRERGIDVGANAYIVKSSFDQNNLLEVVRRYL